tara:strand:+ start:17814 stop:18581 length:768 start_codon:yes stop_codon:yes gene_type:complete
MAKILILGKYGDSTKILFHRLSKQNIVNVVVEQSISKKLFFYRRMKKMGFIYVVGQILFSIFIKLLLKPLSKSRIKSIVQKESLKDDIIPTEKIYFVQSVNSDAARKIIKDSDADFILVSGTRILSKKTLGCTKTKFLNIHAGITPSYRGVHGGYWALLNAEPELCGVTLHYLDVGVDTGPVIGHQLIVTSKKDNFIIYPILQLVEGIKMLEAFLNSKETLNKITTCKGKPLSSKQYYHPTLWKYIYCRFTKGIK